MPTYMGAFLTEIDLHHGRSIVSVGDTRIADELTLSIVRSIALLYFKPHSISACGKGRQGARHEDVPLRPRQGISFRTSFP